MSGCQSVEDASRAKAIETEKTENRFVAIVIVVPYYSTYQPYTNTFERLI